MKKLGDVDKGIVMMSLNKVMSIYMLCNINIVKIQEIRQSQSMRDELFYKVVITNPYNML
ncbi:hypothetical protein D3C75_1022160 [compost metagenome]